MTFFLFFFFSFFFPEYSLLAGKGKESGLDTKIG